MENKGIGIRAVGQIVDGIIAFIVFFILGYLFTGSFTFQLRGGAASSMMGVWALIIILYFILMEGTMGQTVGKMATGIKVVKEDGSPCDMKASLIRNILRIIDAIFVYIVGAIIIAQSDKNQRLGDMGANTVVVGA